MGDVVGGEKIFDGYIEFGFDRCGYKNDSVDNILAAKDTPAHSDIVEKICMIQDEVKRGQRDNKVLVNCRGLKLSEDEIAFLRFWYGNDSDESSVEKFDYKSAQNSYVPNVYFVAQ